MQNWIEGKTEDDDIVLSSRIRLARNIEQIPFPCKISDEKGKEIVNKIEDAFYISDDLQKNFKTEYLWENEMLENKIFLEKHLISPKLLSNNKKSAFIGNTDETISIMINEEDHLRLQSITAGFNLHDAYNVANKFDDLLEERLNYAFDEKLGYLTACPTNLGTGLRASVMIHLPALSSNNEMEGVLKALTQIGITIRGLFGEGTKADGNIYQISNQVTLGLSEEDIINNLNGVIYQIINQEKLARENIYKIYRYELEDKIYRSFGLLKSAVLLNSRECLNLLSNVRMGLEMGIIKDIDKITLNKLLVQIEPANLQSIFNKDLSEKERDLKRAEFVRGILK